MLVLLTIGFSTEAKLYKWVDENGKVHYSDKMPPDQIRNAHETLSEHGVVKDKVEKDLTDEEKIAQAEEIKKKKEQAKLDKLEAERIARERNALLMSYSSADQITRLKAERISALQRNIETARENLIIQERNQKQLMSRAADKERSGEVVSDAFLSQIDQIKEQIEYQKKFIEDKTAEIQTTAEKYEDEMAKYLMYTGGEETEES
jgi:hypothetical protein